MIKLFLKRLVVVHDRSSLSNYLSRVDALDVQYCGLIVLHSICPTLCFCSVSCLISWLITPRNFIIWDKRNEMILWKTSYILSDLAWIRMLETACQLLPATRMNSNRWVGVCVLPTVKSQTLHHVVHQTTSKRTTIRECLRGKRDCATARCGVWCVRIMCGVWTWCASMRAVPAVYLL